MMETLPNTKGKKKNLKIAVFAWARKFVWLETLVKKN